ncbi:MAG TPA: LysE family transporter [Polyangiaceae bacterium]|nr:LysE family transporter [Polyangiaceae bacterium]
MPGLLRSALIGYSIALIGSMPMTGPVAVLYLRSLLQDRRRQAFAIVLGGALAEGGCVLAIGSLLPTLVRSQATLIPLTRGLGAAAVGALGLFLLLRPMVFMRGRRTRATGGFIAGAAVSALNPALFASWTIVLSSLYANHWLEVAALSSVPLAAGVSAGSVSWFCVVLMLSARLRRYLNAGRRLRLLRGYGVLLLLAAIALAIQAFVAPPVTEP